MLNRIRAVGFQPLRYDSHEAMEIKRHHIRSVAFRHAASLQDRHEHMAEHFFVDAVCPEHHRVFNCRSEKSAVFFDVI